MRQRRIQPEAGRLARPEILNEEELSDACRNAPVAIAWFAYVVARRSRRGDHNDTMATAFSGQPNRSLR
ncbi:MAG TPA: hypothetical protein VHS80_16280 [Chthoniobacterales bacterium]|nr:hypothetical protein [Chthoniobacterales bacterium]